IFGLPVVILAMVLPHFRENGELQALLTTLCLAGPGRAYFVHAAQLLRKKADNMDTVVSQGAGAGYGVSLRILFNGGEHFYFESSVMIVSFVLGGKFLEEKARDQASASMRQLIDLQPQVATVKTSSGVTRQVPRAELVIGMQAIVGAGERIPSDGVIVEG